MRTRICGREYADERPLICTLLACALHGPNAPRTERRTMLDRMRTLSSFLLLGLFVVLCGGSPAIAQDTAWHVGTSSGEVWLTSSGMQTVSLTGGAVLKPGD